MKDLKKIYSIGVDIGGTKMSSVLFDGKNVIADFTLATPKDNLDHFLIMFKALVDPLFEKAKNEKAKVSLIGIGIPGVVDESGERILKCTNLPLLNGIQLKKILKERFDFNVILDNDANCFIRGEAKIGAGKNYKSIFGMTLGTGIGGGWWVNGEIFQGSHGSAMEAGHMIIDYKNPIDLEDAYHKLTQDNPARVAEEAFRGDILAEKTFKEIGNLIGINLANIINLIDPEIIIIGGGVMESAELFLKEVRNAADQNIISSKVKKIKIVKSKLGRLAGAIGAALLI